MIYRLLIWEVLILWYCISDSLFDEGFWFRVNMVMGDGNWLYMVVCFWLCVVYLNCIMVNIVLFFMFGILVLVMVSSEELFG